VKPARVGEIRNWKTGPGGKPEPWVRTDTGWTRVSEATAKKIQSPSQVREHFLDFASDLANYMTPEEVAEYRQAKENYERASEGQAAGKVDSVTALQAAAEFQAADALRRRRLVASLSVRDPAKLERKPLSDAIKLRHEWLPNPELAKARMAKIAPAMETLSRMISADVFSQLETKPVSIDVDRFSLYDARGKRGTRNDPVDYEGPVILLAYAKEATIDKTEDDLYHEYMHHLWHQNKAIRDAVERFFHERTKDDEVIEETSPLIGKYRYKPDKWVEKGGREYTGRLYGKSEGDTEEGAGMEVLSCGMERLMYDPQEFASQDPEFFDLVISCIRGL